jgi:hypothetical protein
MCAVVLNKPQIKREQNQVIGEHRLPAETLSL